MRFLRIILLFILGPGNATAQLDSLYTQQWNRDPVTNLNSTNSAQRQIITKETIRNSGYTNVSDLLHLIDGWTINYNSVIYPQLQSNGTSEYDLQTWVFMLNGQKLEMNRDPILELDYIGIPVFDIERIEIINSNGMYLGEFTQHGLIHIITQKEGKDEINIGAMYWQDFTTLGGNNLTTTYGCNKGKVHINGTFSLLDFNFKDNSRSSPLFTSGLEFQFIGKKVTHQIQTRSLLGEDRNANYQLLGYLMQWKLNEHNQIRLSSTFNFDNNYPSGRYSITTINIHHRYLKQNRFGSFIWQNGTAYDYYISDQFRFTGLIKEAVIKPYSSINVPVSPKINLFADVQWAFANHRTAPKVSVGMYKRLNFIANYSFVFAFNTMLSEESLWTTRNSDLNEVYGNTYYFNYKSATADFYYNLNFGNNVKLSFNSGLKRIYDLPFAYDYNPNGSYSSIVLTSQFNSINRINFHYDLIKNIVFDVNYMFSGILHSTNEELRPIPKHKFTFLIQYGLTKKFSVWSRSYLQSQTRMLIEDRYNSYAGTQSYSDLPFLFSQELGLSKKVLKGRVNLNIVTRESINGDVLLSFLYVSITANINGIGKSKSDNFSLTQP